MFITDTYIIENLQVLEESKTAGTMVIEGVFQRAGQPNHNKRIYEKNAVNSIHIIPVKKRLWMIRIWNWLSSCRLFN